jgi:YD repeat-containing protein
LTDATTTDTYDFFDGFNRLIQERKSSPTSNIYAVFDRVYNPAGLLGSTSLPYFSSGSASTSRSTTQPFYTTYIYDPLQRVTRISNAVGNTASTYYQWKTTNTDPNSNIKDHIKDAFGNLVNVVEHSTSVATTTYTYDALNDLATTTDALGNVRNFTYDGLGRRLTAQDLHATGDSTFGTTTYTYDDQGNITSYTDPKGQVVNRAYDALNRMLTEDFTGQSGTEIANTYDSCTYGKGLLCTASSTSAKTSNAYDILGRLSIATTTVNTTNYVMSYVYDRQGNIASTTYPNGSVVEYIYNSAGLPSRIQRKPSGGSYSNIINNYDYAPTGMVQNAKFGNNASTTYFYDANALYRLSNLQTPRARVRACRNSLTLMTPSAISRRYQIPEAPPLLL